MIFHLLPTGIKVIGGVKELTGEEFGVYVKRILPGGLASSDGKYCIPQGLCSFHDDKRNISWKERYGNKGVDH